MEKESRSTFCDSRKDVSFEPQRKRTRIDYNCRRDDLVVIPSMESLLAAPPEILYRTVGPENSPRALLTGAEAECFLKVALLAQELDILLELAEESLSQQRFCRTYKQRLQKAKHPLLYPIIPIVHLMEKQPKPELQHIKHQLSELLSDLSASASILRQSAEQNWTLSDSLVHAFDTIEPSSGQSLVHEKGSLAELEEELAQRIERVVALPNNESASQQIIHRERRACTNDGACRMLFPDKQFDDTSKKYNYCGRSESIAQLAFHLFNIKNESEEACRTTSAYVEGEGRGVEEPTQDDEPAHTKTVIRKEGTIVEGDKFPHESEEACHTTSAYAEGEGRGVEEPTQDDEPTHTKTVIRKEGTIVEGDRFPHESEEACHTTSAYVEGEGRGGEEPTQDDEPTGTHTKTVIRNEGTIVEGDRFPPTFTQPKDINDPSTSCYIDNSSGILNETLLRNLQNSDESQGSFVNKSSAAEALAVLALGAP
jgi:hypothetical protein